MFRLITFIGIILTVLVSGCCKDGTSCPFTKEVRGVMKYDTDCGWYIRDNYSGRQLTTDDLPNAFKRPDMPVIAWYRKTAEYSCNRSLYQDVHLCEIDFDENQ